MTVWNAQEKQVEKLSNDQLGKRMNSMFINVSASKLFSQISEGSRDLGVT